MVTQGLVGTGVEKEALWKHLNLFTIQAFFIFILMQRRRIVHTHHKLQTEGEACGSPGSPAIVTRGWDPSVLTACSFTNPFLGLIRTLSISDRGINVCAI